MIYCNANILWMEYSMPQLSMVGGTSVDGLAMLAIQSDFQRVVSGICCIGY